MSVGLPLERPLESSAHRTAALNRSCRLVPGPAWLPRTSGSAPYSEGRTRFVENLTPSGRPVTSRTLLRRKPQDERTRFIEQSPPVTRQFCFRATEQFNNLGCATVESNSIRAHARDEPVLNLRVRQHHPHRLMQIEHPLVPVPQLDEAPVDGPIGVVQGCRSGDTPLFGQKIVLQQPPSAPAPTLQWPSPARGAA